MMVDSDTYTFLSMEVEEAQHDELEPNLKKILHRNGIWSLEAIAM